MGLSETWALALTWWPALGAATAVAAVATGLVLAGARRWHVLDRPNERSAHGMPVPTLGGIGVLAGAAAGLAVGPAPEAWRPLALGCGILAILVIDDLRHPLTARTKLAVQLLAAAAWLCVGPRLEAIALPVAGDVPLGGWSWPVTVLWLVGLMNVVNFMDGIDGITATQTIASGVGMALALAAAGSGAALLAAVVAAAALGFLIYNRPPARIFMGDVGSHAIGLALGGLAIVAQRDGVPFWLAAAMLGYYLYDTSYTLVRRALRGERLYEAHNQHLYQRLVQAGWSHGEVDGAVLALNALLVAGALLSMRGRAVGWAALLAAGFLLVVLTLWLELRDSRRV